MASGTGTTEAGSDLSRAFGPLSGVGRADLLRRLRGGDGQRRATCPHGVALRNRCDEETGCAGKRRPASTLGRCSLLSHAVCDEDAADGALTPVGSVAPGARGSSFSAW